MTSIEKLLRDLIALPSVNPAFLPADDPRGGERRMTEFLSETAARAGLAGEIQNALSGRPNLLVSLRPARKATQRVLLAPHLDTVNVASGDQFRARRRGDRLYGRGACDTKGSVAAMMTALCELARSPRRPRQTEILFAGLVDEEYGQAGSRALAASGLKADLAIIGEPTQCRLVTAHKGSLFIAVETRGRAAHGATPQHGRNAVVAMARVVERLETDYAAALRRRRHPLLGHGTVSVGTISGGTQSNIVPDHCAITLDRRTLPGETEAGVCREIAALLAVRKLGARVSSVRIAPCPPLETSEGVPLVRQFLRSLGQPRGTGVHYFCDAAIIAGCGISSVVFGPGDIAQAHTADEWISLRSLERAKSALVNFLLTLP